MSYNTRNHPAGRGTSQVMYHQQQQPAPVRPGGPQPRPVPPQNTQAHSYTTHQTGGYSTQPTPVYSTQPASVASQGYSTQQYRANSESVGNWQVAEVTRPALCKTNRRAAVT
uniref:Uncharacterized protein n=1 Tax=Timema bartmani TaxID=61472 RepID=A0A7R9I337_9NEOP|nr:unnamed protein product [Timema bartmani]